MHMLNPYSCLELIWVSRCCGLLKNEALQKCLYDTYFNQYSMERFQNAHTFS